MDGGFGCEDREIRSACKAKTCHMELKVKCGKTFEQGEAMCQKCTWDAWPELRAVGCKSVDASEACQSLSADAPATAEKTATDVEGKQPVCIGLLAKVSALSAVLY